MAKKQIGITLSDEELRNLEELIEYYFKTEGIKLTKSQTIARLINLAKAEKEE